MTCFDKCPVLASPTSLCHGRVHVAQCFPGLWRTPSLNRQSVLRRGKGRSPLRHSNQGPVGFGSRPRSRFCSMCYSSTRLGLLRGNVFAVEIRSKSFSRITSFDSRMWLDIENTRSRGSVFLDEYQYGAARLLATWLVLVVGSRHLGSGYGHGSCAAVLEGR